MIASKDWFNNCGGWKPAHSLSTLKWGIDAGFLNSQDEYGLTGLYLAVMSGWEEGIEFLLKAGAKTEIREYHHGTTPLYAAVIHKPSESIARQLIAAGADPDMANYYGITPRRWRPEWFAQIPQTTPKMPEPRIQNAEHLADHHHPNFQIPELKERVSLKIGQAVNIYVYGPESKVKQNAIKVRITRRTGLGAETRYHANLETLIESTHLLPGTTEVQFGPENVATVYVSRSAK